MKDYTNYHPSKKEKIKSSGENLFYKQFRGVEGFKVSINGEYDRDVIIQQHTNPINERLEDKLMIFLKVDGEGIDWGDEIIGYDDDYRYLVITEPHDNEIYMTCKIRKLPDRISFKIKSEDNVKDEDKVEKEEEIEGLDYECSCILNDSMLYTESSYVGSSNAFEDEDIRALIVRYDEKTAQIELFDCIETNNAKYRVVFVDKKALMRQGEEVGVLQITLIQTVYDNITRNIGLEDEEPIEGVLRSARLKEAVYNSNARTFLCEEDGVKTGDYVSFNIGRKKDNDRTHIVVSMIDTKIGYDSSFVLHCSKTLRWIDTSGSKDKNGRLIEHEYPIRWMDNKTMLMETNSSDMTLPADIQQGQLQDNEFTKQIKHGTRFISNGEVLKVVGVDRQAMNGLLGLRLEKDEVTKYDNEEIELAEYYRYYNENGNLIKPDRPDKPEIDFNLEIVGEDELCTLWADDYSVEIYNNGVPIEEKEVVVWDIRNKDGTTDLYASVINQNGYNCTVLPVNDFKNAGKTVILKVSLTNEAFIEKEIMLVRV